MKIYIINVAYGQYVYAARNLENLYEILKKDSYMRFLILGETEETGICDFDFFSTNIVGKDINEIPLKEGFLGGYQE